MRRDPDCVLPNLAGASTFTITDAKLYVPIVTLSTEGNAKLSNQLSEGFKRPIYWNNYKVVPRNYILLMRTLEKGLISVVKELKDYLFLLMNTVLIELQLILTEYTFLEIKKYNTNIDGRNFYDQPINDLINQYDEVRKVSTGQGDDCTSGFLLDFAYFRK